jgi:hypothetical protein
MQASHVIFTHFSEICQQLAIIVFHLREESDFWKLRERMAGTFGVITVTIPPSQLLVLLILLLALYYWYYY